MGLLSVVKSHHQWCERHQTSTHSTEECRANPRRQPGGAGGLASQASREPSYRRTRLEQEPSQTIGDLFQARNLPHGFSDGDDKRLRCSYCGIRGHIDGQCHSKRSNEQADAFLESMGNVEAMVEASSGQEVQSIHGTTRTTMPIPSGFQVLRSTPSRFDDDNDSLPDVEDYDYDEDQQANDEVRERRELETTPVGERSCRNCHKSGHWQRDCWHLKGRRDAEDGTIEPRGGLLSSATKYRSSHPPWTCSSAVESSANPISMIAWRNPTMPNHGGPPSLLFARPLVQAAPAAAQHDTSQTLAAQVPVSSTAPSLDPTRAPALDLQAHLPCLQHAYCAICLCATPSNPDATIAGGTAAHYHKHTSALCTTYLMHGVHPAREAQFWLESSPYFRGARPFCELCRVVGHVQDRGRDCIMFGSGRLDSGAEGVRASGVGPKSADDKAAGELWPIAGGGLVAVVPCQCVGVQRESGKRWEPWPRRHGSS